MKPMTFAEYLQVPAVNYSTLKELRRSPKHYRYLLENPREDSVRFALGRGAHTAVLEPMRFLRDYALFEGKVRRGKEWDAFEAANKGKTILKDGEYQRCLDIAAAVKANPVAASYLTKGVAESPILWTDATTGLACKARPDWIATKRAIVDIKTAKDIDSRWFGSQCARLGYHGQAAFYRMGHLAATGEVLPFIIIAVEVEAPHDVAVYRLGEDELYAGECEVMELLAKVKACREADSWPGRYDDEQVLTLPSWATGTDEEDSDVSGLDLLVSGQTTNA